MTRKSNEQDDVAGWQRLDVHAVYRSGCRLALLGTPKTNDESQNCDNMGCGTDHVLLRAEIDDE